jgi:L-ascorbate metabolism protein UlaG (beta-lactamase superfamily)
MRIKYLGHAAFLLTANKGIKIITDPYESSVAIKSGSGLLTMVV